MGKEKESIPAVFCLACPDDIKEFFHKGNIKNSDLEMEGLLMLCAVYRVALTLLEVAP